MLLLEGLLLFKHLVELIIGSSIAHWFKTGADVVLFVEPGRARVRRGAIHSFSSLCRLVVGTDHLLMKKLVGDTRQTVLLFLFLLHLGILNHVEKSAIQDDLSLGVIAVTLHPECLNLAFILQTVQELLCEVVDITKNDTLVALAIGQGQLLQSDLILLRLADRHKVT